MRDSLKNPLHFVGIRQSAPTVKKKKTYTSENFQRVCPHLIQSIVHHFDTFCSNAGQRTPISVPFVAPARSLGSHVPAIHDNTVISLRGEPWGWGVISEIHVFKRCSIFKLLKRFSSIPTINIGNARMSVAFPIFSFAYHFDISHWI